MISPVASHKTASSSPGAGKSVGELGGQYLEFPNTGETIEGILDWFNGEMQALPDTFAEANQNITCYAAAGILKMLARVGCEHLPELQKLAVSSNASLLHEIPTDIGKDSWENRAKVVD
jgi:hypothetical protein